MPLLPGAEAPPLTVEDAAGAQRPLAALWAGRPALLFFFKGDCAACEVAAPVLPRFAEVAGLAVAAVAQDPAAEARAFAAAHGWGGRVELLVDPEPWAASEAFGVRATPTWILVGPGGAVEVAAEGWSRDDANALASRAAALAGSPAVVVSSPADGGPALRPG